jgi:mannose-6-phosphate isomerase
MLPEQIRLEPVLVVRPWGGRRLERFGRLLPPGVLIGESWELADLPGSDEETWTTVADGTLAGATLFELMRRFGQEFLGSAAPTDEGRFPLLVKVLDAREHLSVQVHPSIAAHESIRPKTESWYVIDAEADSSIWFDIRPDVSGEDFAAAAGTAAVVGMLDRLPATAGDFHHIPAGRVHALGAGVMVLEVQTPSDTTFRIYDWTEEYGRETRQLHIDEAMRSVIRDNPAAFSLGVTDSTRELVRSRNYWMREHLAHEAGVTLDRRPELRFVTVVAGEAALGDEMLTAGDSRLLPAGSNLFGRVETTQGAVLIETGLV